MADRGGTAVRTGTAGVRPLVLSGSEVGPPAPRHLSRESKAIWRVLVVDFEFTGIELGILQRGLESADLAERARVELASAPLSIVGGENVGRINPLSKTYLDACRESRLALASLAIKVPAEPKAKHRHGRTYG
jgi:hypothetical protein